jgi:peptidoglycan/xylan/chitin deacetylase (PgdA/CDA1 family)
MARRRGRLEAFTVLMYHRIGDGGAGREPGEEIYTVREEAFREQIQYLRTAGHRVMDLHQLVLAPASAAGQGAVVVTFDDGSRTDIEVSARLLHELGFGATFFVTPAWVGSPGFMDWPDIRELLRLGMTIGAHGLDHTPLSSLPRTDLDRHLRESRRELAARLGTEPVALSLPGGAGGRRELQAARETGFRIIAGSVPRRFGPRDPQGIVPRFAVRRTDSAAAFEGLVEQRPLALARALGRHLALRLLRRALGENGYQRLRAKRGASEEF